jgi:hypothetical protein
VLFYNLRLFFDYYQALKIKSMKTVKGLSAMAFALVPVIQ